MSRVFAQEEKVCPVCSGKFMSVFRYRSNTGCNSWSKYCSHKCRGIDCAKRGENHPHWKGDAVSYKPLHEWIRKHSKIPLHCEDCGEKKRLEAANISGEYKRDLTDWKFLCSACHDEMDGITANRTSKGQFGAKKSRNAYIPYPNAFLRKKGLLNAA